MLGLNYHCTNYMLSAKNIKYLPIDIGIEVAFTGCSNAGKSSVINTLTSQKKLAYTSKTPGRTQLINLFEIIKGKRLVDLPGYGYAKVPISIRNQWLTLLTEYVQKRHSLKGLVVVMDIRNPLKDSDNQIIKLAIQKNISVLILLTKVDKLSASQIKKQLNVVINKISCIGEIQIEIFSSLKKIGVDNLSQRLDYWFMNHNSY